MKRFGRWLADNPKKAVLYVFLICVAFTIVKCTVDLAV